MTDSLLEERLQSFIESEGKSCSFDPELITPEYVYRMWGGSVAIDEIDNYKPSGINYKSIKGSIADKGLIDEIFAEYKFDIVVNLAAQAGVRYSIENPDVYILRAIS